MPKSIEYMQDNNLSEKHAKCLNWEKLLRRHNSDGLINYLILLALDSMSSAPALRDLRLASPSSDRIRISGCLLKPGQFCLGIQTSIREGFDLRIKSCATYAVSSQCTRTWQT